MKDTDNNHETYQKYNVLGLVLYSGARARFTWNSCGPVTPDLHGSGSLASVRRIRSVPSRVTPSGEVSESNDRHQYSETDEDDHAGVVDDVSALVRPHACANINNNYVQFWWRHKYDKIKAVTEDPASFDQHKHPREVILTPPPRYLYQYLPND